MVAARDAKETARVGDADQRFNHWTAVRNGLMNAHAGLFAELPAIMAMLPDPIDQMKLFELIQIIPSPTRAALRSGNIEAYRILEPRIMGYLRNNSIFTFGKADRARTSATYREILDAMWLFAPSLSAPAPPTRRSRPPRAGRPRRAAAWAWPRCGPGRAWINGYHRMRPAVYAKCHALCPGHPRSRRHPGRQPAMVAAPT